MVYKGTGIEINQPHLHAHTCDTELTALLTLEKFDEQTVLLEPKSTQEMFILLRSQIKNRENHVS